MFSIRTYINSEINPEMNLSSIYRPLAFFLFLCLPLFAAAQSGLTRSRVLITKYDPGWTTMKYFKTGGRDYVFMGMERGTDREGKNARIYSLDSNGIPNAPTYSGRWTDGWTSTVFYTISGQTYMLRLKERGNGSSGDNVQINKISRSGVLDARVKTYSWTEGWTKARTYSVNGKHYLFILKEHGTGRSGHNAHIHVLNIDGTIGRRIYQRKWSSGWSSAEFYSIGNKTFFMRLKEKGNGDSGYNVHIDRVNVDGTIGSRVKSYGWSQGWTSVRLFQLRGKTYLTLLKKKGYGASGKNYHIHPMNSDGSIGKRIFEMKGLEGWEFMEPYNVGGRQFILRARPSSLSPGGNNIVIDRFQ